MDTPHSARSSNSITVDFLRDRIRRDRDAGDLRPLADYLAVFSAEDSMVAQAYFSVVQESTPPPATGDATILNRSARTSMLSATRGGPVYQGDALAKDASGADHVGPYRLSKELGRGGQGAVHLAEDTRLGRRVALKLLTGVGSLTEANLRRFHREAELASKLDHPGICAVFDFGAFEGVPYIAMRFVEGDTLAKKIAAAKAPNEKVGSSEHIAIDDAPEPTKSAVTVAESPFTTTKVETADIIRIMEKAARAIHSAHEAGVIHRDLKPGNIMVDGSGDPVVLDFGLARDLEGEGLSLTRSGDFLGTPAYMSPEQIAAGHIHLDRRSDVYSLGVTLYECLTLRRPFDAPTREALYQAILSKEPPDPRKFNKLVSTDLKVVLETALNKDRDKRYVSAEALADDLRRVIEFKPITAKPISLFGRFVRWAQRSPGVATATAVAFLSLAIGLIATLVQKADADAQRKRAEIATTEARLNLQDWLRLADGRVLDDLVQEANTTLWPGTSAQVPRMEAWLASARDLGSRLEAHRTALEALRSQGQPGRAASDAPEPDSRSTRSAFVFATPSDQLKHDQLAMLVEKLGVFLGARQPESPTLREVEERLASARTLKKRTIDDYAAVWRDTIAAIGRAPAYGGLVVHEQEGLIPLGPDPKSGLHEFTESWTGVPVRRGEGGRLEITADSALVFVLLPGGTFHMGAQSDDKEGHNYDPDARIDEAPVTAVTLAPFLISKYEMTQGQWLRFVGKNPSQWGPGKKLGDAEVTLLHPVEQLTWSVASDIIARLSCDLPTEAQWEYAARAGTETPWLTGTDPTALQTVANLADQSFKAKSLIGGGTSVPFEAWDDGIAGHAPIGIFEPNRFGLHDMIGNVWEWCRDSYVKEGYARFAPQVGDGFRDATSILRIYRGSSFRYEAATARSAYRGFSAPSGSSSNVSVRPVRALRR